MINLFPQPEKIEVIGSENLNLTVLHLAAIFYLPKLLKILPSIVHLKQAVKTLFSKQMIRSQMRRI